MVYLDVRALKDEEEAIFEAVLDLRPAASFARGHLLEPSACLWTPLSLQCRLDPPVRHGSVAPDARRGGQLRKLSLIGFEDLCTFLPASALYRWEREEGPLETLGRVSPEEFWPGCSEQVERPSSTRVGLTSGKPATFPA